MQGEYDPDNLPSLRDFLDSLPKKPCPKKLPGEYCKLCNRLNGDVASRCKAGEVSKTADTKEFMKVKEIKPVREEKEEKTEPSSKKRGKLSILEGPEYDEGLVIEVTPSKKVIELLKAKEKDLPKFKAVREGAKTPGIVPHKPKPFVPLSEWKKRAKPRKRSMYIPPPPEKRPEKEPLFRSPGSLLMTEETFFTVADEDAPMTFQTEEVCPDCGKLIPFGDNRCSGCGYEIPSAEAVGFQIMEEEETSFQIFDEDPNAIVVEAEIVEVEPEIVDATGETSATPTEMDNIKDLFEKTKEDEPVFKMVLEEEAGKPAAEEGGQDCPDCGLTIPLDSEFCHHCGFKIEAPLKKPQKPLKTKPKTRKKVRKAKVKKPSEKREEVGVKKKETVEEKTIPSEPMGMEPRAALPKKREIQFKVKPKIRKRVKKTDVKKIPEKKEEITIKEGEPKEETTKPSEVNLEAKSELEEIPEETKTELTAEKDEDLMMGLMEEPRLKRKMPSPEPMDMETSVSTPEQSEGKEIELEGKDEEWLSILQEGLEEVKEKPEDIPEEEEKLKVEETEPKTGTEEVTEGALEVEPQAEVTVDEERAEDIPEEKGELKVEEAEPEEGTEEVTEGALEVEPRVEVTVDEEKAEVIPEEEEKLRILEDEKELEKEETPESSKAKKKRSRRFKKGKRKESEEPPPKKEISFAIKGEKMVEAEEAKPFKTKKKKKKRTLKKKKK